MTQLTLNIPDKELDFFIKLVEKFNYKLVSGNKTDTNFILSDKQLEILDKRSKTPIDKCISAKDSIKQIKKKYGI